MPEETYQKFLENLNAEYYKLVGIVSDFDKNLLTVKGWGVTLGLAALAWGFQNQHYGLFLIATIAGLAFWMIEAVMKRHQMRYYVRMREIEVISFDISKIELSRVRWFLHLWSIGVGNEHTKKVKRHGQLLSYTSQHRVILLPGFSLKFSYHTC